MMVASEVAIAMCTTSASGTPRAVSTMVMKGTRIMPPPMPSRPAAKPPKAPMASRARIISGSITLPHARQHGDQLGCVDGFDEMMIETGLQRTLAVVLLAVARDRNQDCIARFPVGCAAAAPARFHPSRAGQYRAGMRRGPRHARAPARDADCARRAPHGPRFPAACPASLPHRHCHPPPAGASCGSPPGAKRCQGPPPWRMSIRPGKAGSRKTSLPLPGAGAFAAHRAAMAVRQCF